MGPLCLNSGCLLHIADILQLIFQHRSFYTQHKSSFRSKLNSQTRITGSGVGKESRKQDKILVKSRYHLKSFPCPLRNVIYDKKGKVTVILSVRSCEAQVSHSQRIICPNLVKMSFHHRQSQCDVVHMYLSCAERGRTSCSITYILTLSSCTYRNKIQISKKLVMVQKKICLMSSLLFIST